ncbi:acyl carrier protein [Sphingomonas sp. SUN039]|uniref:acyl carrier protein n=1 Tax=Sphingomonas sp. SUN039 TaxID=2937787 RepID=UPI00216415B3|nr:acyl carrier protein [Sphingomonas sp. SUN039]UVO52865.1 acyl carrier protein [Sphingomonas sp. SUN039]
MTEDEIYAGIATVFRQQLKMPDLMVSPGMTAGDVKGWDSLTHIRLILAVEKQFGVKFRTSEVSSFRNVGDLAELVRAKIG